MFAIEITTTDSQIEAEILRCMKDEMDIVLRHAAAAIQVDIANLTDQLIKETPEYASLLSGQLMGELGLADPRSKMNAILAAIRNGIQVWTTPLRVVGRRIDGGLNIGVLTENYREILDLAEASYVSEPSGSTIPWLSWLIGAGDRIIVFNYDVEPALTPAQRSRSRSKKALMFKGKGWRVPPNFSGVWTDNFLTRAFDVAGVESRLDLIVQNQINRRLK